MKKLFALLLCLSLMSGLVGAASATTEKPLIGILAPAVTHGWVAGVSYYAEQMAKELGLNYKMYTANNAEEMSTYLDDLITQGAKAIVMFPQWEGTELAVQMAVDAGIYIVNFDIAIDVEGVYRLSGDNESMGIEGAKYIADKLGGKGKVVVLDVPTSGSVAELRKKGFLDTIATVAPEIEIIGTYATEFVRENGLQDMADILVTNPQIDAVYSMDDETTIGALQAIMEAGRTDIKVITGGGGCQEYFAMMTQPEYQNIWLESATYHPSMVKGCVQMAVDLVEGKTVEKVVIIPSTIVDRENCADFIDASSPY